MDIKNKQFIKDVEKAHDLATEQIVKSEKANELSHLFVPFLPPVSNVIVLSNGGSAQTDKTKPQGKSTNLD